MHRAVITADSIVRRIECAVVSEAKRPLMHGIAATAFDVDRKLSHK
jgi:hypothetical protein